MVDQDEIKDRVYTWMRAEVEFARANDLPFDFEQQWEQFVTSHDDETAAALRQSTAFEVLRLADAFVTGLIKEIRTGVPLDESVLEDINRGGSPSFTGDRDLVRRVFDRIRDDARQKVILNVTE